MKVTDLPRDIWDKLIDKAPLTNREHMKVVRFRKAINRAFDGDD